MATLEEAAAQSLEWLEAEMNRLCAKNEGLSRQLAECQANAPKALRAENQKLRGIARLFEEKLSQAENERDDLRRQLAECQAELLWHKTNGVSGVKGGRQDEQYYRP